MVMKRERKGGKEHVHDLGGVCVQSAVCNVQRARGGETRSQKAPRGMVKLLRTVSQAGSLVGWLVGWARCVG